MGYVYRYLLGPYIVNPIRQGAKTVMARFKEAPEMEFKKLPIKQQTFKEIQKDQFKISSSQYIFIDIKKNSKGEDIINPIFVQFPADRYIKYKKTKVSENETVLTFDDKSVIILRNESK